MLTVPFRNAMRVFGANLVNTDACIEELLS